MIKVNSEKELKKALSDQSVLVIHLEGTIEIEADAEKECLFEISRQHLTVIGRNGLIKVKLNGRSSHDFSVFKLTNEAKDITFENINIELKHQEGYIGKSLSAISNYAKNTVIRECTIKIEGCAGNVTGIMNDGNLNTTLETRADNCIFTNNHIYSSCRGEQKGTAYGIINIYANSANISGNEVTAHNTVKDGRAVCLYNSGRFLMVNGNKYNSINGEGDAIGIYNNGMYMLFSQNDVVVSGSREYGYICPSGSYSRIEDNTIMTSGEQAWGIVTQAVKCMILHNRYYATEYKSESFSYGTLVYGNIYLGE